MSETAGVRAIDHFNLDVPPEHLDAVSRFYTEAVGLYEGERPDFPFPGRWLYAKGVPHALVHLASYTKDDKASLQQATGRFNHVCFSMQGLNAHRDRLEQGGFEFKVSDRPGSKVVQLFLTDPTGVMVELNFSKALEGLAVTAA